MSKVQKLFLIQFLESNPELKSGKFTQDFTFKKAQALWKEVAEALNAMPGSKKEWEKWRKTWHDMKNAKGAVIKRHQAATGGEPPIQAELSNEDERILGLIAPVAIEGHQVLESQAVFVDEAGSAQEDKIEHHENKEDCHEYKENLKGNSEQSANKYSKIISRRPRIQRLNHTSEKMVAQMEQKLTIRQNYFTRKLQIMKRDVIVKKRIASALEIIARAFKKSEDENL